MNLATATVPVSWNDVVRPKEHGSWSIALEPLALGLIAAPSLPGALIAGAAVCAFLGRRPARLAVKDSRRRTGAAAALALLGAGMAAFGGAAIVLSSAHWIAYLLPIGLLAAVFLAFDLGGNGRDSAAEVVGSMAFGLVPAMLADAAGWPLAAALGLAAAMCARSLPTVTFVRSYVRAAKAGARPGQSPALVGLLVVLGGAVLAFAGVAPRALPLALAVLAGHTLYRTSPGAPTIRAKTLGIEQAILGAGYVLLVGASWGP